MSGPPSGPQSPQEERGGARLQGEVHIAGDLVSVNLPEPQLDDGDVILAPTREDLRSAFNAVAGGPPILFGTSAGAAWRAASVMLPELKAESRRPKSRFGWLGAPTPLFLTGIALIVVGGLFFLDIPVGVAVTGFAVIQLVSLLAIRLSLSTHDVRRIVVGPMRFEVKLDTPIERIPKTGSSKDAEPAQAASPDKE